MAEREGAALLARWRCGAVSPEGDVCNRLRHRKGAHRLRIDSTLSVSWPKQAVPSTPEPTPGP